MKKLLLFAAAMASLNLMAVSVGDNAPDFSLSTVDGKTFTLSEHKGKVILIFMLGHSCSFCQATAPKIESDIVTTYGANENFLAIGADVWNGSTAQVAQFRGLTSYDIALSAGGLKSSYGFGTQDVLYVVDKAGKIAFAGTPYNGFSDVPSAASIIKTKL
ncbi:MAG: redoxin domain-containing protein, partial [Bacteroidales bacterium]|nr:redoxin domain-containing protein [Bacteroidales bacterium]